MTRVFATVLVVLAMAELACAQSYPARTIRLETTGSPDRQ